MYIRCILIFIYCIYIYIHIILDSKCSLVLCEWPWHRKCVERVSCFLHMSERQKPCCKFLFPIFLNTLANCANCAESDFKDSMCFIGRIAGLLACLLVTVSQVCMSYCDMGFDMNGNTTVLICDEADAASATWQRVDSVDSKFLDKSFDHIFDPGETNLKTSETNMLVTIYVTITCYCVFYFRNFQLI